MKKFFALLFIPVLFFCARGPVFAQEVEGISAEQLGINFSQIAMSEFGSVNPGQDTSLLASRAQEYGREMAKIMLEGKVPPEAALEIVNQCAPWYAEALTQMIKGNDLNSYINRYVKKITDLFSQNKLDLAVQSNIVMLTSDRFEKMYRLLNPSFYHYQ